MINTNIAKLIEETIQLLENDQIPASTSLQRCIRIAAATGQYRELIWLKMENHNHTNKEHAQLYKDDIVPILIKANLKKEYINEIMKSYWEKFLQSRSYFMMIDGKKEDQVCVLSTAEIETQINFIDETLNRNQVPNGLHPLDAYYVNEDKKTVDSVYTRNKAAFTAILARLRTRLSDFLVNTENMLSIDEVNMESKNVFIIHGANEAKWRELEKILKEDFSLNPVVLQEQPDGGCPTIIEKFEHYAQQCSYAFAIFTPDDVVEKDGKKYLQARQNVIFELGWFCARLSRNKVSLLLQNDTSMEIFSDFQGVLQKRFTKNIKEISKDIERDLKALKII